MTNARTIKSKIRKAGFDLNEWRVEKAYKCYNVTLMTYGLSDNERQAMTGDEVNKKKSLDNEKVEKMGQLLEVIPHRGTITIYTDLAPSTWK